MAFELDGIHFIADAILFIHLKRMVNITVENRLSINFIEFGGLRGYAPSLPDEFRHAADI